MAKITVYIGRFNPFHYGHARVLEEAIKTSDRVIVLIGSSGQARSIKNPFTFTERSDMISGWAKRYWENIDLERACEYPLTILPIRDYANDIAWIDEIQRLVNLHRFESDEIVLTGSDRDDSTWYLHSFPQWKTNLLPEQKLPPNMLLSATSVREIMYRGSLTSTDEAQLKVKVPPTTAEYIVRFMKTEECRNLANEYAFNKAYRASWSVAPYPPTFCTTDAVVVQSGHVLVVVRGAFPGKGLWALPGGFVNQNERLQDCIVREIVEETGLRLAEGKRGLDITLSMLKGAIRDKEIFDKPDRSTRGRTITTAYLMQLDDTKPLPKVKGMNAPLSETGGKEVVETANAFWLPISEALSKTDRWFEDHHQILECMIGRMQPTR